MTLRDKIKEDGEFISGMMVFGLLIGTIIYFFEGLKIIIK